MHVGTASAAVALVLIGLVRGPHSAKGQGPDAGGTGIAAERFLDNLVGDWQISRKIRGTVVGNTLQATWVLQHRFVQLHMRDVKEPSEYEALVLIGYEEKNERYVAYWCDSFGPDYAAAGFGKRQGNAVQFTFNYSDGPFYNTFTWDPGASKWTFFMESEKKDGTRVVFAEDTVRKR
jgi:uncharacterized protein DUF1579